MYLGDWRVGEIWIRGELEKVFVDMGGIGIRWFMKVGLRDFLGRDEV